jgi:hypothetical protein
MSHPGASPLATRVVDNSGRRLHARFRKQGRASAGARLASHCAICGYAVGKRQCLPGVTSFLKGRWVHVLALLGDKCPRFVRAGQQCGSLKPVCVNAPAVYASSPETRGRAEGRGTGAGRVSRSWADAPQGGAWGGQKWWLPGETQASPTTGGRYDGDNMQVSVG